MANVNRTRFALLGFLAHGPKTGYDLRKEFEERTAHFWSESLGQVYPTLRRLHEEGLLARDVLKQEGRPDRILYSITEDGLAELDRWLVEPSRPQPVRNEQLLKLFFASPRQASALLEDVRRHLDRYRAQAVEFDGFEQQINELAPSPQRTRMWLLNLSLGKRILKARIEWCEEAVETLSEIAMEEEA